MELSADIILKTPEEIEIMSIAGSIAAETLGELEKRVQPGVTTLELDKLAEEVIRSYVGAEPAFLGYEGHPGTIHTQTNEGIVKAHGAPNNIPLKEGDIVLLDTGVKYQEFYSDTAITVPVGEISPEKGKLLDVARQAMQEGINSALPGNTTADIGKAIESCVDFNGFEILDLWSGHGIGKDLYETIHIPNFYNPANHYVDIQQGMTFTVEPVICSGEFNSEISEKKYEAWSKFPGAMFEHTIVITERGNKILTSKNK
jgi:methionyl aminopeptidase